MKHIMWWNTNSDKTQIRLIPQILMKCKLGWNKNCDEIQTMMKHKLWQSTHSDETNIGWNTNIIIHKLRQVTNCDKTQIVTKDKLWQNTNVIIQTVSKTKKIWPN